MNHYKSWSGLNKQLTERLCAPLKTRITYLLTRYHDVHNAYGRAAIRLDGTELVVFSWIDQYRQEFETDRLVRENDITYEAAAEQLKPKFDATCTYSEMDFLSAALDYRDLSIQDALHSENLIIRVLAILDKRAGKRTIQACVAEDAYQKLPHWVQQFYELRLHL